MGSPPFRHCQMYTAKMYTMQAAHDTLIQLKNIHNGASTLFRTFLYFFQQNKTKQIRSKKKEKKKKTIGGKKKIKEGSGFNRSTPKGKEKERKKKKMNFGKEK